MTDCNYRMQISLEWIISIATCEEHRLKIQDLKYGVFSVVISKA